MYEIFKSVIASKTYNLEEMIKKINTRWVEDTLTEEQRKELIALAQKNADPNLSNAPLQKQIEAIAKQQNELKDTVTTLSATVQKIKVWEPYNGIPPIKWQKGSKCTHNGKKWESMVDNNVWEPGAFGVGEEIWREVIAE